jgi:hypothetical protein
LEFRLLFTGSERESNVYDSYFPCHGLLRCPLQKNKNAEQADAVNHHAFGTFGTSPAEQALVPKASGDT